METRRPYVTFFVYGTLDLGMKKIVLLPRGMRVPTPCARRPISFARAVIQVSASGPLER